MLTQKDYERAVKDESYRQRFLKQIHTKSPDYVTGLYYQQSKKIQKLYKEVWMCVFTTPLFFNKYYLDFGVHVFPDAFNLSEPEFNAVLFHEFEHCYQFSENPKKYLPNFSEWILRKNDKSNISELDAYLETTKLILKNPELYSEEFLQNLHVCLEKYHILTENKI